MSIQGRNYSLEGFDFCLKNLTVWIIIWTWTTSWVIYGCIVHNPLKFWFYSKQLLSNIKMIKKLTVVIWFIHCSVVRNNYLLFLKQTMFNAIKNYSSQRQYSYMSLMSISMEGITDKRLCELLWLRGKIKFYGRIFQVARKRLFINYIY